MRVAMYTDPSNYIRACEENAEAIRKNGLRQAREMYEESLTDKGWTRFFGMNPSIPEEARAEAYDSYKKFWVGEVKRIERQVRKYEREAEKTRKAYGL